MLFYFNEASVQGQFSDDNEFKELLEQLMIARRRSPLLSAMRVSGSLADRPVLDGRSVRNTVQRWKGENLTRMVLAWMTRNGPFIAIDRLDEEEDLFYCQGVEVTDGGLGEAARRVKNDFDVASISFPNGEVNFAKSPLHLIHGFEDEPIAEYDVKNFWDIEEAVTAALLESEPADSWEKMVEFASNKFPLLRLPEALYQNRLLSREPFDPIIRDRFYTLLGHLHKYMSGRNHDGSENAEAQYIVSSHFHGDRSLFSAESEQNKLRFRQRMTFPDPDGGADIFADYHGKISHRTFRLHFEWPVPPTAEKLKILYIGPKLTKS